MTTSFLSFHALWRLMGPELVLAIAAFIIMLYELIVTGDAKKVVAPWLSVIASIGALVFAMSRIGATITAGVSVAVVDDFGSIFAILLLISTILVLLFAIAMKKRQSLPYEYSYLVLFATVGAMVLATATDLVTLYVGLELLSITTYVLVALYRKSPRSSEGGLKYLIMGSIASATILYGMSFLFGISGSTDLSTITVVMQTAFANFPGLAYLSLALIVVGIGVKISAVPFHLWTADVYEGAPTPVTAYLAVVSKAAVFALLIRLTYMAFGVEVHMWYGVIGWIAVITMIVGNFGALAQKNVKRLLAYSSIGNAGYMLIPFAVSGLVKTTSSFTQGLSSLLFYLFAYAFMTIGAFAIYAVVASHEQSDEVDAFAGLYKRNPWLAGTMALFLLALAGMPLTGGFVGKLMIFIAAFNAGQYWLGVVLFATSVVAFYYYFSILRAMFMKEPKGDSKPMQTPAVMHIVIVLCAVGILWLGIFPTTLSGVLGNLHWFA